VKWSHEICFGYETTHHITAKSKQSYGVVILSLHFHFVVRILVTDMPTVTSCLIHTESDGVMGVRLQQLKKKILSKLHISRQTVLLLLGKYSTRVCVVLVWCGVLWSFVGTSAFPRISGAQQNDGQLMCLTQDEAKLFSQDLAENIDSPALNSGFLTIVINYGDSAGWAWYHIWISAVEGDVEQFWIFNPAIVPDWDSHT